MPVLSATIPSQRLSTLAIELLQFGLGTNAEVIDQEGNTVFVDIVGPIGKAGEAVTRAGGEILTWVDKVRL
jgi:hypothetical protein